MLKRTGKLYKAQYALAAALVGQALRDPGWQNEGERHGLLAAGLGAYRRALDICAAPGVVHDARWILEIIRGAGREGIEPVFDLLKNAANQSSGEL